MIIPLSVIFPANRAVRMSGVLGNCVSQLASNIDQILNYRFLFVDSKVVNHATRTKQP